MDYHSFRKKFVLLLHLSYRFDRKFNFDSKLKKAQEVI